ncbi:unnamed protein product [Linum tenue]|uniref:Uncharacterized protein n=1 Tax=Linum tenue TaxID=586396 RepID=A0AAV0I270_9ROSI|nr:unnamed protein product [Linum tenue]
MSRRYPRWWHSEKTEIFSAVMAVTATNRELASRCSGFLAASSPSSSTSIRPVESPSPKSSSIPGSEKKEEILIRGSTSPSLVCCMLLLGFVSRFGAGFRLCCSLIVRLL